MRKHKHYHLNPIQATLAKRQRLLLALTAFGLPLLFMGTVLSSILNPQHTYAASYTWDGGGVTNNWSDCDNWSTNICPVAADSVTFNATSTKDSTIDAAWGGTLTGLTIASGYTGTITMDRSLTMSGAFTQAAGNFTATNQTLDLNSTFALSAGNFTASSGVMSVAHTFLLTGGGFAANGGTVTFDGTATSTLSCNNVTFNLVVLAQTAGTKTVSNNCSFPIGTNTTIAATGSTSVNGTLSGGGTLTTTGALFLTAGSTFTGFTGLVANSGFQSAITTDFGSFTVVDFNNGGFTLNSGAVFTAPSGTATFGSAFVVNAGATFNANGGTVVFDGATTVTLICNNTAFNSVVFANASGTKTVGSGCSLPLGLNPTAFSLTLNGGTISGSGLLTVNSAFSITAGTNPISGFSGLLSGGLSIGGASLDFGSYTTFDINANFALGVGASFIAPSGTASFAGGFNVSGSPTFDANGGTVTFDGTAGATINCGNIVFNTVTMVHTTNAKTVSSSCTLPLGSSPTIGPISLSGTLVGTGTLNSSTLVLSAGSSISGFSGLVMRDGTMNIVGGTMNFGSYTTFDINGGFAMSSGSFTAPSGTASFAGSFNVTGGTFDANGGTVVFDGTLGATLTCTGVVFNTVAMIHTTNIRVVSSSCTLPLGSSPTIGPISLSGTLVGTGTLNTSTLTLNSGSTLSGFSGLVGGGAFTSSTTTDFSGYSVLDFNSTFVLNTGSIFTAPSGTASFASTFTLNSGSTFNANSGTVVFDGTANVTLTCNNATFNLVRFAHTANTKTVSNNCQLPLGNNPVIPTSVALNGTLSGTGTLTNSLGTLTLSNTAVLGGFTGLVTSVMTVNGTTLDFSSYTLLDINGNFTLNSGAVFTAAAGTTSFGGSFTVNSGTTFNANGGTTAFDGTATGFLACNNTVFNFVTFTHTDNAKVVGVDCTMPVGNNPVIGTNTADFVLNGTLVGTGAITFANAISANVFNFNSTGVLSGFTGLTAGVFSLIGPTFDASAYTTFNTNVNFTLSSGAVFTAPAGTMTVGRDFTVNPGTTFNANNSTVTLNGTDQTLTGDIEFHNLTKTTAGILTVGAGNTITTTGLFKLSGPSLVSSAPGSVWNINMQGSTNICGVSVTDSNSIGNAVVAYQSNSYSTNPGWVFLNAACPGSGGGGGGGGGGGEPVSTVTNYTNAQAAATAVGIASTSPNTTLPPYYGLPSTLAKTVDTIPGSRDALRAFLRFVGITGLIMLLTGGVIWFVASKRRKEEDAFDAAHWNGTRVG